MSKERIVSWLRQVATMQAMVNSVNENLDQLKGNLHMANAVENAKHKAAIQTDIERFQRDKERMEGELLHRVNTTDLEGVNTRISDLQIRLELVDQLHEQWRRRLAQYEFLRSTNGFAEDDSSGGVTMKRMNELIDEAKAQYEAALANADALIPNKSVLINV